MKQIYLFYLFTTLFFVCCTTRRTSTIVSCEYDEKHDQTNYMIFPYGTASIPGKWDKTSYNTISKQQFFKNEKGVAIAISFGPCNKYEFNTDKSKKGFAFVKAFYEWDSQYLVSTYGLKQELIEENELENYIIWRIYGYYNNSHWDTYFLIGEKRGFANNYSIMDTDMWTIDQKIKFLKEIYLDRKENK